MEALLVLLSLLIPFSSQQCLTASDKLQKLSVVAHESLVQSEQQFSSDLLHTVSGLQPDKNVLFSPSSIFRATLMTYFFSANRTETTLKKVLHLADDKNKLDIIGAYNMENYYQKLRSAINQNYQLSNVNRVYHAKNMKVNHCMKVLFLEELAPANFEQNLNQVVKKINSWVAGQTRNVIKNFLTKDSVSKDTQLAVINAAYFKGSWKSEFSVEDTLMGNFYLTNGSIAKIPMMTQMNLFKIKTDKKLGAEVLELPYSGDDISMLVMLPLKPSPSAVHDLIKRIDSQTMPDIVRQLETIHPDRLSITIPKFTVEETLQLTPVLESMGLGDLFKGTADLSTLAEMSDLRFSEALHKAKIQVDEKGTEAAAATGFIYSRMGADSFIADRPFVYVLYDKTSSIILFFGIFNSPQLE